MTAQDIVADLRRLNPGVRYAHARAGSAVGEWVGASGRFVPIYERTIDGRWVQTFEPGGMIRETMVNGRSAYEPADWVE